MADSDCKTASEMCPIKDGLIFSVLSSLYTWFPSPLVLHGLDCKGCIRIFGDNTQSCGIYIPSVLRMTFQGICN